MSFSSLSLIRFLVIVNTTLSKLGEQSRHTCSELAKLVTTQTKTMHRRILKMRLSSEAVMSTIKVIP